MQIRLEGGGSDVRGFQRGGDNIHKTSAGAPTTWGLRVTTLRGAGGISSKEFLKQQGAVRGKGTVGEGGSDFYHTEK